MIEKKNENFKNKKFFKTKKKNKNYEKKVNEETYNLKKSKKVFKKNKNYVDLKKNKLELSNKKFKNKNKIHFNNKYGKENKILNDNNESCYENEEKKCNLSIDDNLKEDNMLNTSNKKTNDGSNIENNKIDYVDYINIIKNSDENNLKKTKKPYDEVNKGNLNSEKVLKIFLLFSPLDVTSIRNKSYLINADDHMEHFQNKLKDLETSIKFENNENNKKKLEKLIDNIKNKLDNIRPDILFYTLLCLRDSILNKKQRLQIYIHTINNILIYISPLFRVPRSFALFKKVMLNLLKKGVVHNDQKQTLLKIQSQPVKHYIGNSICVGISNKGFPTDIKKFCGKIKETNNDYSFFISLSNSYDITKYIEIIKKKELDEFSFNYFIRLSDLSLSPVIICSKLTHFLN